MRYSKIKFVPTTSVGVMSNPIHGETASARPDGAITLINPCDGERLVNELLAEGWEIVEFITHHSTQRDITTVAAIMGKPFVQRLLTSSIDTLDLTVRMRGYLRAEGIQTIGDLTRRTEVDLIKMPYVGQKTLRAVKQSLRDLGLTLRGSS